jgi:hypothetical protein
MELFVVFIKVWLQCRDNASVRLLQEGKEPEREPPRREPAYLAVDVTAI